MSIYEMIEQLSDEMYKISSRKMRVDESEYLQAFTKHQVNQLYYQSLDFMLFENKPIEEAVHDLANALAGEADTLMELAKASAKGMKVIHDEYMREYVNGNIFQRVRYKLARMF